MNRSERVADPRSRAVCLASRARRRHSSAESDALFSLLGRREPRRGYRRQPTEPIFGSRRSVARLVARIASNRDRRDKDVWRGLLAYLGAVKATPPGADLWTEIGCEWLQVELDYVAAIEGAGASLAERGIVARRHGQKGESIWRFAGIEERPGARRIGSEWFWGWPTASEPFSPRSTSILDLSIPLASLFGKCKE